MLHLYRSTPGNSGELDHIRVERFDSKLTYTDAFKKLSEFYTRKGGRASEDFKSGF